MVITSPVHGVPSPGFAVSQNNQDNSMEAIQIKGTACSISNPDGETAKPWTMDWTGDDHYLGFLLPE